MVVPVVGEDRRLRQEDKQVDGVELEREEERRRGSELVEDDAEAIHELDSRSASDRDEPRTAVIAGAMHQILDGEHIIVEELELSQRQARALEALKTATCGRDQKLDAFVYAEDRRALLEQALAVLQPDLAVLQQLGGSAFEELLHGVGELREQLASLEDAQEELEAEEEAKAEADDKDDSDDDDVVDDVEEEDEEEEEKEEEKKEDRGGGKAKTSTLTGPPRPEVAKPPTTLGEANDIADAARDPWWKRG